MSNEIKVLRAFVREFSPIHAEDVKTMSYEELFEVVGEVVQCRKES